MTDQTTAFEYCDEDGDDLIARPMRGIPAVLILTGTNGIAVDLDRVEEVVAGIRDAARQAAGQQPKPTMAYGDGRGRVYCLGCASVVGADVALTVEHVDHWELCPSCGRHVVDVARQAAGQPAAGQPTPVTPEEGIDEARKAIQHVIQIFLDRVPRDELEADIMADSIADALSDELGDLYERVARAESVVEQPAEAQPAFVDELLAITRAIGRKRFAAFLAAQRRGIRADALREAADEIDAETVQLKAAGVLEPGKFRPCRDASAQLRRKADEETR